MLIIETEPEVAVCDGNGLGRQEETATVKTTVERMELNLERRSGGSIPKGPFP